MSVVVMLCYIVERSSRSTRTGEGSQRFLGKRGKKVLLPLPSCSCCNSWNLWVFTPFSNFDFLLWSWEWGEGEGWETQAAYIEGAGYLGKMQDAGGRMPVCVVGEGVGLLILCVKGGSQASCPAGENIVGRGRGCCASGWGGGREAGLPVVLWC